MSRLNVATAKGRELGAHVARLVSHEIGDEPDNRCMTCAGRAGNHLANGSPETLMSFVKAAMEREPFWCHEHDRPCAAWLALRVAPERRVIMPWDHPDGFDGATDVWIIATDGTVTTTPGAQNAP